MKTLYDKIWDAHTVHAESGKPSLLYIDLHLIHEVTTPQAFDGLREANRKVRRPDLTIGTLDHSIPTKNIFGRIADEFAAKQIEVFRENCQKHNIKFFDIGTENQGIVHVFAPEMGLSQPGMTIVCGDSHTSTHGAFGALAFGIGTSEVEQVLATQCIQQTKSKNLLIKTRGKLSFGVTAKDLILHIIGKIGTDGANGFVIEYAGEAIENLSMEARMTVCNMSIEAGARAGLIAPDATIFEYLKDKFYAPKGENWERAVEFWQTLPTDTGAKFDKTFEIAADEIEPYVSWGTTPAMVAPIGGKVPELSEAKIDAHSYQRALNYMDLQPSQKITEIEINRAFIGSCTNSRIEDLREAAKIVKGYKVNSKVSAMVVPGSQTVKKQAEAEGLAKIFTDAGFEWRESGCSMCVAMNDDFLLAGERCASTSNRNFEGRQGRGGRTHLASPATVAAAAICGHFVDVRDWRNQLFP
jgi:3-isopropylmalate/(R)-2-methylmalate dehydratase large subunit